MSFITNFLVFPDSGFKLDKLLVIINFLQEDVIKKNVIQNFLQSSLQSNVTSILCMWNELRLLHKKDKFIFFFLILEKNNND